MSFRKETVLDYQGRILKVMIYLQEHMDESVDLETLSKIACFSPYHFHRIFTAFVGETLSQYTRRIRLDRAAVSIANSMNPITDIALRSGYETPASFSKAFKRQFALTPTEFRKQHQATQYVKPTPELNLAKEYTMIQHTLKKIEAQRVLFVRKTGPYNQTAAQAWEQLMSYVGPKGWIGKETKMIGISQDSPEITGQENCRYDACITVDAQAEGEGEFGIQTIPGGTYAVFMHQGPYENLQETYGIAFSQWLPNSSKELREVGCFELYLNNVQDTDPEDLRTEVYIPIQ